ncbi:hypothetical protein AKO1_002681 [Acrasis kona]|uniref:Uncharacterized protein n=1 Tax=Acrasis kona TaxID=1008807 RepID=A0AAW2ZPY5_9EUKA
MNESLAVMKNSTADLNLQKVVFSDGLDGISRNLFTILAITDTFRFNASITADAFVNGIDAAMYSVLGTLQCGWVTNIYYTFKDTIYKMAGYAGVAGIACILIGVLSSIMFGLLLPTSKYMSRKQELQPGYHIVAGTPTGSPMSPSAMTPMLQSPIYSPMASTTPIYPQQNIELNQR